MSRSITACQAVSVIIELLWSVGFIISHQVQMLKVAEHLELAPANKSLYSTHGSISKACPNSISRHLDAYTLNHD